MNKIVILMNNALIIPVLPCIINIIIKVLCNSPFNWGFLDKGTLSFSVSMYLLACLKESFHLDDTNLSRGISSIYITLFIISIVLFSSGVTFDTLFDIDVSSYVENVHNTIGDKQCPELSFSSRFETSVLRIDLFTLGFSLFTLVFSEFMRQKYKIDGEII